MTPEEANTALQFMQRIKLRPREIQAWQNSCMALQALVVVKPEALDTSKTDETETE